MLTRFAASVAENPPKHETDSAPRGRTPTKTTVLGGTGRTGRLLAADLLADGHDVAMLVREPAKAATVADRVTIAAGDIRDTAAVATAINGADAVASALGPVVKDTTLLRDTAAIVVRAMGDAHVSRYVGISGAGLTLPGDRKRNRDRIIFWLLNSLGGMLAKDKIAERAIWQRSGLDWTLVRVPGLVDGAAREVDHDAHLSGRRTTLRRSDLARFITETVANGDYSRSSPFVSDR